MSPQLSAVILKAIRRHKDPLWLVGGPVRDGLLNLPCKDWDFAGRHARVQAQSIAKALKAKFIVLDEQNKIYRVILPSPSPVSKKRPLPRGEGRGEGPETLDFAELQGKTIEADLSRRDFTMNAMARRFPDGEIIDPFGGKNDLRKRLVKAVAESVFPEDPLRVLRAFRFMAQFDCQIEKRTLQWITRHRRKLENVSAERIREELLRFWKQPNSLDGLRLMDKVGLLSVIFPDMEACRRTAVRYYGKGGVLKHSLETVEALEWLFRQLVSARGRVGGSAPIPRSAETPIRTYLAEPVGGYPRTAWLKWAAFLHDIGKPATAKMIKGRLRFFEHEHVGATQAIELSQKLRLSRQEGHLIGLWVRNHMRTGNLAAAPKITDKALSRYFRDLGEEGIGMILVSLADHYTYLRKSQWGKGKDPVEKVSKRLLSSYFEQRSKILPARLLDGHVLMQVLKLKPGPLIGRLLNELQDAQAEGKVTTREEALAWVRRKAQVLKR